MFSSIQFLLVSTLAGIVQSCDTSCNLQLVESIPENLTYPAGSPISPTTYSAWQTLLSSAKVSVDIASYYWTLIGHGNVADSTDKEGSNIFDQLSGLSSRGVKLRIVQNPPDSVYHDLDTQTLIEKGQAEVQNLDFTKLMSAGILHTKLWVVDKRHFYMGSANMDWRSLTQVKELGVLGVDCECLAMDAQKLFDVYWYLSLPGASIPHQWPVQFSAMFNATNPLQLTIEKTPSQIYWASSPPPFCASDRSQDIDTLLSVINSADKFVNIAVMDYFPAVVYSRPKYYWGLIDDALRAAAYNRGVHVRLMGSYWNHTEQDMVKFLKSLSADSGIGYHRGIIETRMFFVPPLKTKNIPFSRVNHNKYMVTDKAAYIGTSNWSGDYFINTGGVSLTVTAQDLNNSTMVPMQMQLYDIFMRDWNSTYTSLFQT